VELANVSFLESDEEMGILVLYSVEAVEHSFSAFPLI